MKTPTKHERNIRALARAQAYARIAREALYQCIGAITQLEIGPSSKAAEMAHDHVYRRMGDLDTEIANVERLVCS